MMRRTRKAYAGRPGQFPGGYLLAALLLSSLPVLAQSAEWTFVQSGSINGVYGTVGVAAAGNVPAPRAAAATWTDTKGNLWLFGGSGYATVSSGGEIHLNDLWEFNPATQQWTWFSGGDLETKGVYGTQGAAAAGNNPGSREAPMGWSDQNGNVWIFGGWGYDSANTFGVLNDLWEFNPQTLEWTWVAGNSTVPKINSCWPGNYGTIHVSAASNAPGGRQDALSWADTAGNLWMFGGGGCGNSTAQGQLNDLWQFNVAAGQWIWAGGASTINSLGSYGTIGVASSANIPSARWSSTFLGADSSGNIWLYGGQGFDSSGVAGLLDDLWKFDPAAQQWTWVSGVSTVPPPTNPYGTGQPVVYGTLGQFAAGNSPGGRGGSIGAVASNGNLLLYGGSVFLAPGINALPDDLWTFNPGTATWAWIGGSSTDQCLAQNSQTCFFNSTPPDFGTMGIPAATNEPGGRAGALGWSGKTGDLWLFGGQVFNGIAADLWEYGAGAPATVGLVSNVNDVFIDSTVTYTATVTGAGASPSGIVTFYDGPLSVGKGTVNSSGQATDTVELLTAGTHSIVASYSGDINYSAAASATLPEVIEDFSITPASAVAATSTAGGTATYSFSVAPASPATTLPSQVSLSATGGPAGTTYAFSPATVSGGASSSPVTLTVTLPLVIASRGNAPGGQGGMVAHATLAALLMPLIGLAGWRPRSARRRWMVLMILVAGIAASVGLSGCGKDVNAGSFTQSSTYVIVVTGAAGSLTHSASVSVTVQ